MVCSKSRSKVATVLGVRARQVSAKAAKRSLDRKSTRLNSSHGYISYAVFCLKKKKNPSSSRGCPSARRCPLDSCRRQSRDCQSSARSGGVFRKLTTDDIHLEDLCCDAEVCL